MMTPPSRSAFAALGLILGLARATPGQDVPPPPPPGAQLAPAAAAGDLDGLARRMVEEVRRLGEAVAADLGPRPSGRHLIEDTRELDRAVDEFRASLRDRSDPYRARRAYSGVDQSWHHLRGQLARPDVMTPAVDRATRRVDEVDARLHAALGLNAPPPGFYDAQAAPSGVADVRRLAHALVDRAEALEATIRANAAAIPDGVDLARDASRLARAADAFHDAIDAGQPPDAAAQAFRPVEEASARIGRRTQAAALPPTVQPSWESYVAAEVLVRQGLSLPAATAVGIAAAAPQPPSLADLGDQLVATTTSIQQAFAAAAGQVTQGPEMATDAQRLQAAAVAFRQDVARGLPPNQLAFSFREVDACWQRMARRVNRVAKGNIGPNVAMVLNLGGLCQQIHQALGMPGYPPTLNGPAFP